MKRLASKRLHEAEIMGSVRNVALGGGYLYIYFKDKLLHIASIPSPNLLGDRSLDTEVENHDEFMDENNNKYIISIYSSSTGIHWELDEYPNDQKILDQIHYEVKLNEY